MNIPQYVTVEEVRRVCREIGIRDWTALTDNKVLREEAEKILAELNVERMMIRVEDFHQGLEVELEHGLVYPDSNITNNHPLLTGKIVLAHFMEFMDYYKRLEVCELEGDLLKAVLQKKPEKIAAVSKKLAAAKEILSQGEIDQLKSI